MDNSNKHKSMHSSKNYQFYQLIIKLIVIRYSADSILKYDKLLHIFLN